MTNTEDIKRNFIGTVSNSKNPNFNHVDYFGHQIRSEHTDQLMLLIAELKRDNNSFEFREPVRWRELGLVNYNQIIKNPMDI